MNSELLRYPEKAAAGEFPYPRVGESSRGLRVVAIYENAVAERWVEQFCERVTRRSGGGAICMESWNAGRLSESQSFDDAVSAAIEADVIVISACAAGTLPLSVYIWIDNWLPRRGGREGSLVVLVGAREHSSGASEEAQEYLRAVARLGRLEFLLRDQRVPSGLSGSSKTARIPGRTQD